ncbi:MAG: DUF167 domain-containing protein [Patescibacteria group bacterium]|jgi:hypothetical protein
MLSQYIKKLANNKEIYLKIRTSPSASRTGFLNIMADGTIKIAVAAAPEKGLANQELIKFLADELGVRKYQVKIVSGVGEKSKLIKVSR